MLPRALKSRRLRPVLSTLARCTFFLTGTYSSLSSKAPPAPPIGRPKDLVMQWMEAQTTSTKQKSNRITLVRNGAEGNPVRDTFLDNLHSPFGVALVGNDLYVANTDAIVRYSYTEGDTKITAPGTVLTPLPGGPIDHHWTKSLLASRDGSLLYVGVGSNSNITENGMQAEENRASIWEVDRASGRWQIFASGLRNPNGLGASDRRAVGRSQRTR